MFSTSVLISPFLGSENSISGHLLKPILQLYLLDLCFTTFSMTVHGSASTYVPYGHKMHVAQYIHLEYHIHFFFLVGGCILPQSPLIPFFFFNVNPIFAYL